MVLLLLILKVNACIVSIYKDLQLSWRAMMRLHKVLRSGVLLVFCFAVILCGMDRSNIAQAADWPHWRGPDYNGISKETNWVGTWSESGPKVLWEASIGTGVSS